MFRKQVFHFHGQMPEIRENGNSITWESGKWEFAKADIREIENSGKL